MHSLLYTNHLKNKFNSKSTGEAFIQEYCEYYRLSKDDFFKIYKAESETHFAILLEQNWIFEKWQSEANEAIKLLEKLTGNQFVIDSTRTQYHRPEQSKMMAELERLENGYYSEEAKKQRENEKNEADFKKIEEEEEKEIEKIKKEYTVKKLIFKANPKALENTIFYTHNNTIKFNWKDWGFQLSEQDIKEIKTKISDSLPVGVLFK
jgi:hypothetical protein